MARALFAFVVAAALAAPLAAQSDESRQVSGGRIRVADVVATAAADIGAVDLGAAAPPGGSRLLGRGEIEDEIRANGLDPKKIKLPPSVRVVSAAQRLQTEVLARMATPAVERALPEGVTLTRIQPQHELVTSPGAVVRAATVPRLPRQRGTAQSTATLEIAGNDDVVKVPVGITVEISEAAAHADVQRGARVEVVFERGAVKIATVGVALSDAEIGDTTMVNVVATARAVRVRVVAKDRAEIVERP